MNTYYFLTSPCTGPNLNAGSHFISDGIKELVHRTDPDAILQDVTLFNYNAQTWSIMLARAKGIFLCGNPRFDPSETHFFWLTELLEHMQKAQAAGIKIGDLFLGTAYPLPLKDLKTMSNDLATYDRNVKTAKALGSFDLVITRDVLTQAICAESFKGSSLLPDSTFWAKDYYGVFSEEKEYNCVTIPSLNCTPGLIKKLYKMADQLRSEKTTYFLCHAKDEYWLAQKTIPDIKNLIIIYDPKSLLEFYARVDKLVCCRLHGAIPALSMGAKVMNIAMDSRAMAYDVFGFKSVPYTDLKDKYLEFTFDRLKIEDHPSATPFIKAFTEKIIG